MHPTVKTPWTVSSVDPDKVALTIKGILTLQIPLILIVLKYFHVIATGDQLTQIIELVATVVGSILTLVGLFRKFQKVS